MPISLANAIALHRGSARFSSLPCDFASLSNSPEHTTTNVRRLVRFRFQRLPPGYYLIMSQPEHKLELESQFILRLPKIQANALRQAIKSGEPLAKRLSIKFENDVRHGTIKFDNWTMQAKLFDLPTIIESYKTLDRKNFYKTADVSQIMICREGGENEQADENDEDSKKAGQNDLFASVGGAGKREFLFPHGITPPLKNVRKRRFRKTLKKKYVDISEIEKEVKRLFRFDSEAIDIRYEIIEENKLDKVQPSTFGVDNAPSPMSTSHQGIQSTENSQNFDVTQLFGEVETSDESSDEDDDDEKDEDIDIDADNDDNEDENMDDEELDDFATPAPVEPAPVPAADIAAEIAAASDLISQNDDTEEKRRELNRELSKIQERIEIQESEMRGLDNQALRQRLQPVLDSLHEQENEIKKQLEELN